MLFCPVAVRQRRDRLRGRGLAPPAGRQGPGGALQTGTVQREARARGGRPQAARGSREALSPIRGGTARPRTARDEPSPLTRRYPLGAPVTLGLATWLLLAAWDAAGTPTAGLDAPVSIAMAAPIPGGESPIGAPPPDSSEGLPIARIDVQARNIFDPLPDGRLAPLFALANRLHIRTREQTVREQLVLRPGDPWSDARGHE